jgi:tRNA wybutosine-synthesizing protein 3
MFEQRKKDILSKEDKSNIGGWDKHIWELCNKINSLDNYYTTSSCSGRIMIIVDQDKKSPNLFEFVSHNQIKELKIPREGDHKFKQEPPILHIACKDTNSAKIILNKIRDAGWKRAGIISLGKNIIIEVLGTDKIEFPLVKNGKLLVDEDFLELVIEKSNKNLQKGWDKINQLVELL